MDAKQLLKKCDLDNSNKNSEYMNKQRSDLSIQVANEIFEKIMANDYAPGSFLPSERELQQNYDVSRPVIREAIKHLAAKGIVIINSRQGTVVNPDLVTSAAEAVFLTLFRSGAYVEDVLNTRMLLEPSIARLAAENATPIQVREIVDVSKKFSLIANNSSISEQEKSQKWKDLDVYFHTLIAKSSQNPVLPVLIEIITGGLWKQFSDLPSGPVLLQASQDHELLGKLIAEKNGIAAEQQMQAHLEFSQAHLSSIQRNLVTW